LANIEYLSLDEYNHIENVKKLKLLDIYSTNIYWEKINNIDIEHIRLAYDRTTTINDINKNTKN
jgi:hypothetical protein